MSAVTIQSAKTGRLIEIDKRILQQCAGVVKGFHAATLEANAICICWRTGAAKSNRRCLRSG